MPAAQRPRLCILILGLALLLSGCRLSADLSIQLHEDGTADVVLHLLADDALVDALGGTDRVTEELRLDDLTEAGWTVEGPTPTNDGLAVTVRRTVRIDDDSLERAMQDLGGGPEGLFPTASATVTDTFAETSWRLLVEVDRRAFRDVLVDPALAKALGGSEFGRPLAELEEEFDQTLDELLTMRVSLLVPEPLHAEGIDDAGDRLLGASGLTWDVGPTESNTFIAHSERTDRAAIWFRIAALGVASLAFLVLMWQLFDAVRMRRARRSSVKDATEVAAAVAASLQADPLEDT